MITLLNNILQKLRTWQSKVVGGIALAISGLMLLLKQEVAWYMDPIWICILCCGVPILVMSIKRLVLYHQIKAGLLISLAMIASICIGERFAAGEVVFIMAMGGLLEDFTVARAKKGLNDLIKLAPEIAHIVIGSEIKDTSVENVNIDDIIRVLPGEIFPLDGEVLSGVTSADQSIITGESLPVDKNIGDKVYCGTMNIHGTVDVKVLDKSEDSSLKKMIKLVKEAEEKRAPMQNIADKWASILVPMALLLALITFIVTRNYIPAVTILVVFCPCSLVLATPTAIMGAIGQATKQGVLIKSGEALEALGKVNTIAFDKTGTLTDGNLVVSSIVPFGNFSERDVLSCAASLEMYSEHPIAKAICNKANEITLSPIEGFVANPGMGVLGKINGEEVRCGSLEYIEKSGIKLSEGDFNKLTELQNQGKATMLVSNTTCCMGIISLSDSIRENASSLVKELKDLQIEPMILTGDNKNTASYVANVIGIDNVKAALLPEDKTNCIKEEQVKGRVVAMVGDGVNDAPSMKMANVGIAMGSFGSDIAINSASIALMTDDVSKLVYLKKLSNETMRTIRFSITLSMVTNAIAILMSIAGLLTPISGAIVHNMGSVLVVLNAALLYDRKIKN